MLVMWADEEGLNVQAYGRLDQQDSSESGSEYEDEEYNALGTLANGQKDIKHAAATMIVNMRSSCTMTRVGVRRAMQGSKLILKANNSGLKQHVLKYLRDTGADETPRAQALLQKFKPDSPLYRIKSDKGQGSVVNKYYYFNKSETLFINNRLDQRLGEEGVYRQVAVPNTFEYVSLLGILKNIARKTSIMAYMKSRRPSEDGILRSYTDASQFRNHPLFQEFPDAFQLALYHDGVDPARGQGTKSGQHELGNFVIEVLNMPPGLNSSTDAIHPLVIANANDCTGTFRGVLYRFVRELLELENGVEVCIKGEMVTLRGTLVAVKADNKALHEVLGFLACGARHFCALCMISRQDLHAGEPAFGARRTPEMHDSQLQRVALNDAFSTECGVRYRTCLHDSIFMLLTTAALT